MCVCFKHLITFSACRRVENENIMRLLIIALENEIWLGVGREVALELRRLVFLLNGAGRGVALKLRGLFSC